MDKKGNGKSTCILPSLKMTVTYNEDPLTQIMVFFCRITFLSCYKAQQYMPSSDHLEFPFSWYSSLEVSYSAAAKKNEKNRKLILR